MLVWLCSLLLLGVMVSGVIYSCVFMLWVWMLVISVFMFLLLCGNLVRLGC